MQKNTDNIQFESRREIENIMEILLEWQQDHQGDKNKDYLKASAEELYDLLEVMHMCW